MTIQEIIEAWNGCCSDGEGGGGGDFSTAQVTFICNGSDTRAMFAQAVDAEPPFVPTSQTDAYVDLANGDELTCTAIMYKGECVCAFTVENTLSGEGNVTILDNYTAVIAGDCTITLTDAT